MSKDKKVDYNTDEYNKIHQQNMIDFNRAVSGQREQRDEALKDRRFYSISGAQWEDEWGEQFENKPKIEINKTHLSIIRIINEWLNNRITVDFVPRDGTQDDDFADFLDGLYRADEDRSTSEPQDNAFEESVGGGIGGWKIMETYENEYDPENEKQHIVFKPIYDYDGCCFFDLDAMRQDKADAKKGWLLTAMTTDAFIEEFDEDPSTWPKEVEDQEFDWNTPNFVYVAECYVCEEKKETLKIYNTIDGEEKVYTERDFELDEKLEEKILYSGETFDRDRQIKVKKVHKYIMSGNGILDDCGYIAGPNIPIVPMFGKRWVVDSIERFMGHVRLSKDAQRLMNMLRSWLAELASLSPREKPIVSAEQMAGHSPMWEEDNVKNYPYLLLNPITDKDGNEVMQPLQYTRVPQIPPALAALLQISEQDLKDLTGNQESGEKMISNIGEKTVELIQNRLDMQSFIYMSNAAKAVKRGGEIWLGKAKEIYVENNRKMKTIGPDGTMGAVELSKPVMNPETGAMEYENDIRKADYEVSVKVGPSSSSKRAATVKALYQMIQITKDQQTASVLESMAMMNMEGEGIDDVRDYFRQKLIKLGVLKPTDEEAKKLMKELQNQPPNAEEEYLLAEAEKSKAKSIQTKADTVKTDAETEKIVAETIETLSGIDRDDQEAAIKIGQAIEQSLSGNRQTAQIGENFNTGS
jgi:hypothetical protein